MKIINETQVLLLGIERSTIKFFSSQIPRSVILISKLDHFIDRIIIKKREMCANYLIRIAKSLKINHSNHHISASETFLSYLFFIYDRSKSEILKITLSNLKKLLT